MDAKQSTLLSLSAYDFAEPEHDSSAPSLKERIHGLFDPGAAHPTQFESKLATGLTCLLLILILCSCVSFMVESLPSLHGQDHFLLQSFEWFAVVMFTIEYLTRLATAPAYFAFVVSPMNIIDLIAILPFYIELALALVFGVQSSLSVFLVARALRLTRVLRIFKLGRHSAALQLVSKAMLNSLDALFVLTILLAILIVVSASGVFYAEAAAGEFDSASGQWMSLVRSFDEASGEWRVRREPSQFQSVPESLWWAVVTVTTLGYGDMVPHSVAGKLVASVAILCGILVIALPTILVGASFAEHHSEFSADRTSKLALIRITTALQQFMHAADGGAHAPKEGLTKPSGDDRSPRADDAGAESTTDSEACGPGAACVEHVFVTVMQVFHHLILNRQARVVVALKELQRRALVMDRQLGRFRDWLVALCAVYEAQQQGEGGEGGEGLRGRERPPSVSINGGAATAAGDSDSPAGRDAEKERCPSLCVGDEVEGAQLESDALLDALPTDVAVLQMQLLQERARRTVLAAQLAEAMRGGVDVPQYVAALVKESLLLPAWSSL